MHNSKMTFVLLFVAIGGIASFGVGTILYNQYNKFIDDTYKAHLESAARLIKNQFPQLENISALEWERLNNSDNFFELNNRLRVITDSVPLHSAYYLKKNGSDYEYILFSHSNRTDGNMNTVWKFDKSAIDRTCDTLKTEISRPYTGETDTIISAFLPVLSGGAVVGVIGVDQYMQDIENFQTQTQIILFITIIAAIAISLATALIAANAVFKEPDDSDN